MNTDLRTTTPCRKEPTGNVSHSTKTLSRRHPLQPGTLDLQVCRIQAAGKFALLLGIWLFVLPVRPAHAQVAEDGPYVFHKDSSTQVSVIAEGKVKTGGYQGTIALLFPGDPQWNFKLSLKTNIAPPPAVYPKPAKMLVMSDIEGQYVPFRTLLINNGVISRASRWTFGKGHLVICGDLFDRGRDVLPELWLLYKLEAEALAAGGRVHILLGNHDIMNLSGDFRYVDNRYMESAKLLGKTYAQLFARNSELGRWLRSKNLVEQIGDKLFLHGGMSPEAASFALSAERINTLARPFYDHPETMTSDTIRTLLGRKGLFWYRCYFQSPRISTAGLDSVLALYHVRQIVTGHTILARNVALYYKGKVLDVDVDEHTGHTAAALWLKGRWYKVDKQGHREVLVYKPGNDEIAGSDIL